jgi:hypothetical protein
MQLLSKPGTPLFRLFIFGNLFLLLNAVLAIIFYKERIFLDGSYYFFYVVQNEMFHIEHQRFILAFSQLLAVAGAKLHLSLNTLLLLNSLNPVLYLWILFLLSIYWLKHEGIAWALLLSGVCGIYFIWFCPMYEVWYGCVLLIFFMGVLERKLYSTVPQQVLFVVILITLLFSYPLIFIGVIYFTTSHVLKVRKTPVSVASMIVLTFAVWFTWKYFSLSDYESGKIEYPLSHLGNTLQNNFSSSQDIKNLFAFLLGIYPEELVLLIVTSVFLFWKKERLQALLLLMVTVAFILLISITQDHPWNHSNYFERMYLMLFPLCVVPFFQHVFPVIRRRLIAEAALVAILVFRLNAIVGHAGVYTTHVNEIEALMEKTKDQKGSKFTVDFAKHSELSSLDEWSLPMEALIFSSLKSSDRSITISWKADLENPDVARQLNETKFRLRLDEIYPDDWLNQKYFHVEPGPYQELNW